MTIEKNEQNIKIYCTSLLCSILLALLYGSMYVFEVEKVLYVGMLRKSTNHFWNIYPKSAC